jgi:hypothetical protein
LSILLCSQANSSQQSNLQLTSKDLEYLLPNYVETGPSKDLCVAYQDNAEVNRIGPIVLTTSKMFADNNSTGENPNATCWEILTLRLGRFAREHIAKHGAKSITDDMLQREARLILYNDADGWDQTAADNPEWLTLFKKAHGIDASATASVKGEHHSSPLYNRLRLLIKEADVIAQHDLYEDLGLHTNSVLDPSFNLNNFRCLDIVEDHPNRFLAMQCSLSGSVRVIGDAMREADIRRSTQSTPGLSGSNSPTSLLSQAPLMEISPDASLNMSSTAIGESANVGLVSFDTAFSMPPISEKMCNEQGEEIVPDTADFQFPSWDQLPEEFQNPTSSADLSLTIPISSTSFSMPNVESSTDEFMAWDNEEMNFTMDMDLDLDMDLNAF